MNSYSITGASWLNGTNVAGSNYVYGLTGLCIGSDCRVSWPTGSSSSAGGWQNTSTLVSLVNTANNVSANTLFVDNTNGKVGIGTTSPGSKLEVNGAINGLDIANIKPNLMEKRYASFEEYYDGKVLCSINGGGNGIVSSDYGLDGQYSHKITTNSTDGYCSAITSSLNLKVRPSTKYVMSYYAYRPTDGGGLVRTQMYTRENGAALTYRSCDLSAATLGTGKWVRCFTTFTTAADTSLLTYYRFDVDSNGINSETVYFDAVQIEEITSYQTNASTYQTPSFNPWTDSYSGINFQGNVGIGTTAPNTTLHVAGKINVTSGNDICIDNSKCLSQTGTGSGDVTDVLAGYGITVDNSAGPQPRVNLSSSSAGNGLTYSSGVLNAGAGNCISVGTDDIGVGNNCIDDSEIAQGTIDSTELQNDVNMLYNVTGGKMQISGSDVQVLEGNNLKVGSGFGSGGLTIDDKGNILTDGNLTYSGYTYIINTLHYNGTAEFPYGVKGGYIYPGTCNTGDNCMQTSYYLFSTGSIINSSTGFAAPTLYEGGSTLSSKYQEEVGSNCGSGNYVYGVQDDGTLLCSTPSGAGDVTDVLAGYGITVDNSAGPQPRVNLSSSSAGTGLSYSSGVLAVDWSEISNDAIAEAKIDFDTSCGSTSKLYVSGNDLDCNSDLFNTTSQIQSVSVGGNLTGTVGNANLVSNSVDSAKVVDNSLTANDIGTDAVGSDELANNAVDANAIQNGVITSAKLTSDLGLRWNNLTDYPSACSSGQFISQLGDTITCGLPIGGGWAMSGSYLYNNTAGVNVGIGTATPTTKLEVVGTVNATNYYDRDNSQYYLDPSGSSIVNNLQVASGTLTGANSESIAIGATNDVISFTAGGSEQMRIHSDGKVGIGTTGPTAMLHVIGDDGGDRTDAPSILTIGGGQGGAGLGSMPGRGSSINITAGKAGYTNSGSNARGGDINITGGTGSDAATGSPTGSGGDLILNPGSPGTGGIGGGSYGKILLATNGGNVGIGTITPTAKLDINGAATGGLSLNVSDDLFVNDTSGYVGIGTTAPARRLEIVGGGDALGIGQNVILRLTPNTNSINYNEILGSLEFYSTDTSTGATGIVADVSAVNENGGSFAGLDYGLAFSTGRPSTYGERVRIDRSGNVGIGTTNPGVKLEVSGQIRANGTSSTGGFVTQLNSNYCGFMGPEATWRGTGSTNNLSIGAYTGNSIKFFHNGGTTEAMVIDTSGNVGIGTTGPATTLEVSKTTTGVIRSSAANLPSTYYAELYGKYDNNDLGGVRTSAGNLIRYVSNSPAATYVGVGDILTIQNGGNVGIGTTNPLAKLHVAATSGSDLGADFTTSDFVNGVSGSGLAIQFGAASGNTYTKLSAVSQGFGAWNNLILQSGGGNVGIGTASPSTKLEVSGSGTVIYGSGGTTGVAGSGTTYGVAGSGGTTGVIGSGSDYAIYASGGTYGLRSDGTAYGVYGASINGYSLYASSSTTTYDLYVNGNGYATGYFYDGSSDIRLKKNITDIDDALDKTLKLRPVYFEWRQDEFPEENLESGRQMGLIAQEVEPILPEVVITDNKDGYKAIAYSKIIPITIAAIQEQQAQISNQSLSTQENTKSIEQLRLENQQLKSDIIQLKQLACLDHPEATICQ
jgi:hypothetical protein